MTSMNETPASERVHIGIFGKRNAGKSSLLNAITKQNAALVSPTGGTTTDPVYKAMELSSLGPVVLIDTAGIDDSGELGSLRVNKTKEILRKIDLALLVVDAQIGLTSEDRDLLSLFKETRVKNFTVYNKADLFKRDGFCISTISGENIEELKIKIIELIGKNDNPKRLVANLIHSGDMVVLVIPIDSAAPKGRLILPQQQAIRDILDTGAACIVTKDTELSSTLEQLCNPPQLVITDSQVFESVSQIVPQKVPLTSFSILMANYKGVLKGAVNGAYALNNIKNGDKILISEGCTHHRQCDDIGTVKLPRWIRSFTNANPTFEFSSGGSFPLDLSQYSLVIHCGGCMLNDSEMLYRNHTANRSGIPMTNYGVAISHMQGILERCISPIRNLGTF